MKRNVTYGLAILLAMGTISSCNKDDNANQEDPTTICYVDSYSSEESYDEDEKFGIDGDFVYNEDDVLEKIDLVITETYGEENEIRNGDIILNYQNNLASELLITFDNTDEDAWMEKETYEYDNNGKLIKIITYNQNNKSKKLSLERSSIFDRSNKKDATISNAGKYYEITYDDGKPVLVTEKYTAYGKNQMAEDTKYEITWSGDNISTISEVGDDFVIKYEYDNKANILKGLVASAYVNIQLTELAYMSNFLGLSTYFSANNVNKVIIDDEFAVDYNLTYDGDNVTKISISLADGEETYTSNSDIEYNCK